MGHVRKLRKQCYIFMCMPRTFFIGQRSSRVLTRRTSSAANARRTCGRRPHLGRCVPFLRIVGCTASWKHRRQTWSTNGLRERARLDLRSSMSSVEEFLDRGSDNESATTVRSEVLSSRCLHWGLIRSASVPLQTASCRRGTNDRVSSLGQRDRGGSQAGPQKYVIHGGSPPREERGRRPPPSSGRCYGDRGGRPSPRLSSRLGSASHYPTDCCQQGRTQPHTPITTVGVRCVGVCGCVWVWVVWWLWRWWLWVWWWWWF